MKKYFAFSDVHGEFSALLASLDKVGFEQDNEDHILLSLGDNFDRGNENAQVLEFLLKFWKADRLMMIKGNHDDMLITFLTGKDDGLFNSIHNMMDYTLQNLSRLDIQKFIYTHPQVIIDKIKEYYPELIEFYNDAKDIIEIENYIITHAGYSHTNKYNTWEEPIWEIDNWANTPNFIRFFPDSTQYQKDKIYVFGHWHTFRLRWDFQEKKYDETGTILLKNYHIFQHENFIGLDACTNLSNFVNILIIEGE
jgi:serine/threonine protein phosphatase 1